MTSAPAAAEQGAQELLSLSAKQELAERQAELDFAAAMSGLTILRHALPGWRLSGFNRFQDTTCLLAASVAQRYAW